MAKVASNEVKIYVDGSYHKGGVGYGVVVLQGETVLMEKSGSVPFEKVAGTRQVAGELYAVGWALEFCKKNEIANVGIYYDYKGVECWATGAWKANLDLTKNYADYVKNCSVKISWHKVAAHTGDVWNERADVLAKKGAENAPTAPKKKSPAVNNDSQTDTANSVTETKPEPKISARQQFVNDKLKAAERHARSFGNFLANRNIATCFDNTYNDMYARLLIIDGDKKSYFDLYNTVKKPFVPYLHNFKDTEMKLRVERLWNEFKSGKI